MNVQYLRLANDMADGLKDITRIVQRIELTLEKALQSGDDAYLDAVALNLHGFYSGLEHIFEDIARTIESSLPIGEQWHHELLRQMTVDLPTIRPPVIRKETAVCLAEYLKFRHVVRHVYTFNFRSSSRELLARNVQTCFTAVATDLTNFTQFLQQLSAHDH
jgi:hypothetical protein